MTTYTVHLYREMRLVFPGIEASTHEEAAHLASAKQTTDAQHVEDCEGFDYSALVDVQGDEMHAESRTVFLRADGGEIEPAPEPVTNRGRARWAEAALSVFIQHTGCDREDALGDLLCDLMHWSEQHNFDFDHALDRARGHFEAEQLDELPPPPDAEKDSAPALQDALLDIKRLASKHDDSGYDPYTLLELIEQEALAALATTKGGAQ